MGEKATDRSQEPVEDVTGYLKTHIDCAGCGEILELEGDVSGEEVKCDVCRQRMHVSKVM